MKKLVFVKIITVFMLFCLLSSCANEITSWQTSKQEPSTGVRKITTTTILPQDLPKMYLSADMIDGCVVNLDGIKALGIESREVPPATVSDSTSRVTYKNGTGNQSTTQEPVTTDGLYPWNEKAEKNFLVGIAEDGDYFDIVFEKPNGEKIYQEQILCHVDRVYVTELLTYVRFTRGVVSWAEFDKNGGFISNETFESYAIDNVDGKVFSLRNLDVQAQLVEDYYIEASNGTEFIAEVISDELVLTRLAYSPEGSSSRILRDKYGTYLVPNQTMNKKDDNIVYCEYYYNIFYMGDDGLIYIWNDLHNELKYYNDSRQLVHIENTTKVALYFTNTLYSDHFAVLNNGIFLMHSTRYRVNAWKQNGNQFEILREFNFFLEMGVSNGELFGIDNGNLVHIKYIESANVLAKAKLDLQVQDMIRVKEGLKVSDDSNSYWVYAENGIPKITPIVPFSAPASLKAIQLLP